MGPPTLAPSGNALAAKAIRIALNAAGTPQHIVELACERQTSHGVGLETIMQSWGDRADSRALTSVYAELGGLEPNRTHRLIATRSQLAVATMNMDTLLERAGLESPIHLHGVWWDPDSIITDVEGAHSGPHWRDRQALTAACQGAHVVFLGCSGRDEALRLVTSSRPASITWIHFDPNSDLELDAAIGLTEARASGIAVWLHTGASEPYLEALPHRFENPFSLPTESIDTSGIARLARELLTISPVALRLSAASMLGELALWDEAVELQSYDASSGNTHAAKLTGRYLRQADRHSEALTAMGYPPKNARQARIAASCSNEILAAGRVTRSAPLVLLDCIIAASSRYAWRSETAAKFADASLVRRARQLSKVGRYAAALRLLDRTQPANRSRAREWVHVTDRASLRADILKALGHYESSLNELRDTAVTTNPNYLGARFRADYLWRQLEVLTLMPESPERRRLIENALGALEGITRASGPDGGSSLGSSAITWYMSTIPLAHHALGNHEATSDAITRLADWLSGNGTRIGPSPSAYASIVQAEWALQNGSLDGAACWLGRAARSLRGGYLAPFSATLSLEWARLHAAAAAAAGAPATSDRFDACSKAFRRLGMRPMEARSRILAARAIDRPVPDFLVEQAKSNGWSAEHILAVGGAHYSMLPPVL